MGQNKTRVAILCGGRSGEHEVSLLSARSVISAINRDKYDITVIAIRKDGGWYLMEEKDFLLNPDDPARIALKRTGEEIVISPRPGRDQFRTKNRILEIDCIFPVLHGTFGEDGTLQGMLAMIGVPYVGADYLGSAAAMDKDICKRLFREAGLRCVDYLAFQREPDQREIGTTIDRIEKKLGLPVFVKPANLGSSVGIARAANKAELTAVLNDAWLYDTKIIVEKAVNNAREIECSVLGNEQVEVSELGEIKPSARHGFYSYDAKYIDPDGAELVVGVEDIDPKLKREIQDTAIKAFRALCCEGMARADFLVDRETGEVYISELNTIPGFTKISMYPKLWEKSGLSYPDLIDRLIQLALKRDDIKRSLKTDFKK